MKLKIRLSLLAALLPLAGPGFAAEVRIDSIEALRAYAAKSGNTVTMAPGTYHLSKSDRPAEPGPAIDFTGDGNTFDFTGVTLEVDNRYYNANTYRNLMRIAGSGNLFRNLVVRDVGSLHSEGGLLLVFGGVSNTVDGFSFFPKGSTPYGYGSLFGKGGGSLVKLKKKSCIRIEGEHSILRNTTIVARNYGHCVAMQGSIDTLIENCTIEGEMVRTNDILNEEDGLAKELNYMTQWGYRIPPDHVISCQEAGIRCYPSGRITYLDNVRRSTRDVEVRNCTVKRVREGITISDAAGNKRVSGCVVLDCETAYQMSEGVIEDCAANFKHGPVFANYAKWHRKGKATIRVLHDGPVDGARTLAFITSTGIDLTLIPEGEEMYGTDIPIVFAGSDMSVRHGEWGIDTASRNKVVNRTSHPVILREKASGNTVESVGPITDYGRGNVTADLQD
ncbi:hypothetical protein [Pontiella sp.]|uniref:hypothetical protein n=1 Tax=Pontiella sp. TaxID=2837462 RepID=UPI00356A758A